jgi:hypothetical protein
MRTNRLSLWKIAIFVVSGFYVWWLLSKALRSGGRILCWHAVWWSSTTPQYNDSGEQDINTNNDKLYNKTAHTEGTPTQNVT